MNANLSRPSRSSSATRSAAQGFTLLEMIVVLVIIGLIMGLVGPRLFNQADKAKVQTAETQVKMLKGALETMRLDTGRYPTQEEGLALLVEQPTDAKLSQRWKGPYLDDGLPDDPWGNAYQYSPKSSGTHAFALFSLGADGKTGGDGYDADVGMLPQQ
ncbi:type II secretion system major pseudopilin GspG [Thermomonas brevis]|jgi:general secretion pathway protein G